MQNTVRSRRTSTRYTPLDDLALLGRYLHVKRKRSDEKDAGPKLHAIDFSYVKSDVMSFG